MSTGERRGDAPAEPADQTDRDIEEEHRNAQQSGTIFAGQQWPESRRKEEGGRR
ncbi:hypothetical protein [Halorientalis marina]|uniref:hypothetical protein n=1 Tax=Halorientalis marina TaxID=2931976 RepID=UPI001FF5FE92|nr:hypothetical protein [Halorientalis marina]